MTEYLDKLISLFRKARPGTQVSFQIKEIKNHLLTSLPAESMGEFKGYLDLSAADIAQKYNLIHSLKGSSRSDHFGDS